MITVSLLALGYAASVIGFMAWAKASAPEGHEDEEHGFVFAPVSAPRPVVTPAAAPRPLLADGLGLAR
jgi:hypothetical protein